MVFVEGYEWMFSPSLARLELSFDRPDSAPKQVIDRRPGLWAAMERCSGSGSTLSRSRG